MIAGISIESLQKRIPGRLHPKRTANWWMSIGLDVIDQKSRFPLRIRDSVRELAIGMVGTPEFIVRATEANLKRVFLVGDDRPIS